MSRPIEFIGVDYDREQLNTIIDEHNFDKQKSIGGTSF